MIESRLNHIKEQVLPILKGKWDHVKDIQFEPMINRKGEEQFQSIAIFGDIVVKFDSKDRIEIENGGVSRKNRNSEQIDELDIQNGDFHDDDLQRVGVVIKMQICDKLAMGWTNGGLNFFNEIYFYSDIIPYFSSVLENIQDIVPEMVYGYFSDKDIREEDIIILKNLNNYNYKLATSRTVLPLEYILLALTHLGKFHACSYILKSMDRQKFKTKVLDALKTTKVWIKDGNNPVYGHFKGAATRSMAYVEKIPEYKNKISRLKNYLGNVEILLPQIYEPSEKMGVLCHGDFSRNNMLFKHKIVSNETEFESKINGGTTDLDENDKTNVKAPSNQIPIHVKFFDWADIIYASPVVDLAFFLFMHSSQQLRSTHWDTMIQTYYRSLKTETDKFENVLMPSYEDICKEFKMNCMMAFLLCSFFLPLMMEENRKDRSEWTNITPEEQKEALKKTGGDDATKAIGEILMFILDKEFI